MPDGDFRDYMWSITQLLMGKEFGVFINQLPAPICH